MDAVKQPSVTEYSADFVQIGWLGSHVLRSSSSAASEGKVTMMRRALPQQALTAEESPRGYCRWSHVCPLRAASASMTASKFGRTRPLQRPSEESPSGTSSV
jgi:hypothetical protein